MIRGVATALVLFGVWATPRVADAFCRSTTCLADCPVDEFGCKTTGTPLFWPTRCMNFSVQKDGTANIPFDQVKPVIEAGFAAWADLPCESGTAKLKFQQKKDAACHAAEFNEDAGNANIVLFQDYKWQYTDVSNTLAKTTVTYDPDLGIILDADLEINHAFNNFTVTDDAVVTDLQSVIAHEVGHFVGLDHSHLFGALMTATYSPGTINRDAQPDDIEAICIAYPPESNAPCDDDPLGGFEGTCGGLPPEEDEEGEGEGCAVRRGPPEGPGLGWIALGAGVALASYRGRRRRRGAS